MSRLGKKSISVPDGVEVEMLQNVVNVKGPKGTLSQSYSDDIEVVFDGEAKEVLVKAKIESRQTKANHGLYRSLINNMVTGVSSGYEKNLSLEGVGYRVSAQGNKLVFTVGFCHPIEYIMPPSIKVTLDGNTKIKLESHDKRFLGQIASEIRSIRPPEPYKGKGIRYDDEVIRKKEGKSTGK